MTQILVMRRPSRQAGLKNENDLQSTSIRPHIKGAAGLAKVVARICIAGRSGDAHPGRGSYFDFSTNTMSSWLAFMYSMKAVRFSLPPTSLLMSSKV